MTRRFLSFWMGCAAVLVGCGGGGGGGPAPTGPTESPPTGESPEGCLASVWVPGDFDFAMVREVEVEVMVRNLDGQPRPGTPVFVTDAVSDLPGLQTRLGAGVTGDDGRLVLTVALPAEQSAVQVVGSFMGGRNVAVIPVQDGRATIALGGQQP